MFSLLCILDIFSVLFFLGHPVFMYAYDYTLAKIIFSPMIPGL